MSVSFQLKAILFDNTITIIFNNIFSSNNVYDRVVLICRMFFNHTVVIEGTFSLYVSHVLNLL